MLVIIRQYNPYRDSSLRYLLLQLGALVALVTVAVVVSNHSAATDESWDGVERWRCNNRTLCALANQHDVSDGEAPGHLSWSPPSAISVEKVLRKAVTRLERSFDGIRRVLIDDGAPVLSQRGRKPRKWRSLVPLTSRVRINSGVTGLVPSTLNVSESGRPETPRKTRQKRATKPIDVIIRLLTPKRMRSTNKISINFRGSSPSFWKQMNVSQIGRRRQKKKKVKKKQKKKARKKKRKWPRKKRKKRKRKKERIRRRQKKKKVKKTQKNKGKKRGRKCAKKKRRKRKKKTDRKKKRKERVDIKMTGKALKSKKKEVPANKLLKKAIAKQLKRKMRKMSRRAKKALAKMKKSKKARKRLFQSNMASAVRSTVHQAEQVCKSLTRTARQRLGSSRVKVQCRFNDAERLIRRFEKSRSTKNNRKLTKAVSGIMAAVAAHMRPLVDVLYRQTLARRRTVAIIKQLRSNVATVLRRLVRQAFGLRRALTNGIVSNRKPTSHSKSVPPYSSPRTARQLYASIDKMEAGKSKEGMADTVARVISIISQLFHNSVKDLVRVYLMRQVTEKKPERAESLCGDKPGARIGCINAHVFRVLQRMVDRSSSLVRNLNRILPTDPAAKKPTSRVPKAIHVDARLLKKTGGRSASRDDAKQASAAEVARVIVAIARNLRLVVDRLKLAVVRKKLSKSATFKALMGDKGKQRPPTPKPTKLTTRRVGGTITLQSLNSAMLSALRGLEKWSRLLYRQTALRPAEARPEPIEINQLPSTSASQSAKRAAVVLVAIARRLRIVEKRVGKTIQKKLEAGETSTEVASEPMRQDGGPMTLKSLNSAVFTALLRLEKWSRLLYRQTAQRPAEARPEPIEINQLPSTSASQSAKRAALVIVAIARRLRIVEKRVAKTIQKKLEAGKPSTEAASEPMRQDGGPMTLKSLNSAMLSSLLRLEKWSRLLYQQTALRPAEARPEPIKIYQLPSTSASQSAKRAALVIVAIARRLRIVEKRVGKTIQKKLIAEKTSTEVKPVASLAKQIKPIPKPSTKATVKPTKTTAEPHREKTEPATTLKSLNLVVLSALLSLEKWSRLLYRQTALRPAEAQPQPIEIGQLSSTSTSQAAKRAAVVLLAISRRLRIVEQRLVKTIQKKLVAGKTSTEVKPVASVGKQVKPIQKSSTKTTFEPHGEKTKPGPAKPKIEKAATTDKSKTGKKKPKEKGTTSKTKPEKEKIMTPTKSPLPTKVKNKQKIKKGKKEGKKGKKKPKQKGTTSKTKPKKEEVMTSTKSLLSTKVKGKQKSQKDKKKPNQKGATTKTKPKKEKVVTSTKSPLQKGKQKSKEGGKKPQQKGIKSKTKSKKEKVAITTVSPSPAKFTTTTPEEIVPAATSVYEEADKPPEPETQRHVIDRDDIAAELLSQSRALAETVHRIAGRVDEALQSGQYGIQPETTSEAENLWIRFMNERLRSADTPTQKKKTLQQMKLVSGRLLTKATKLRDSISTILGDESDVAVMRSDRAVDASTAIGYRNRHGHRHGQRGRKASFMPEINKRRLATQIDCHGVVDFAKPSSVRSVVNGIKTVLPNSPVVQVAGLTSPAVQQGSNSDSAVEFEFKRPVRLAGIWLHEQASKRDYLGINSTTIYVQLSGDNGTWLPVIDFHTQKPLILTVPSQPTALQLHYSEPLTGLRLYPQSWHKNQMPTLQRPIFITCSPFGK